MIGGKDVGGHMGTKVLSSSETEEFLNTGDIIYPMKYGELNFDNYDRALRREITEEEKMEMLEFARAYESACNLYTLNCDIVAGKIIGLIDEEFLLCQEGIKLITPNNSYFIRSVLLKDRWERIRIGKNNLMEITLAMPRRQYMLYVMIKRCIL